MYIFVLSVQCSVGISGSISPPTPPAFLFNLRLWVLMVSDSFSPVNNYENNNVNEVNESMLSRL